jgi:hypothetical protein
MQTGTKHSLSGILFQHSSLEFRGENFPWKVLAYILNQEMEKIIL